MKKKLLSECLRICVNNIDKHDQRFMHWSFIIINNKIIEWATNKDGLPPIHFGYNRKVFLYETGPKIHSELAAWYKAKGLIKNRSFKCINVRLDKCGNIKNSQPCQCCYDILRSNGCDEFWFTTNIGWCKTT